MKIELRENSVHLEGYINAVGRQSKELFDPINGHFVEIVEPGAFNNSLLLNPDIPLLLNHINEREIARNNKNLTLKEDNIGLHFSADITDAEVVLLAKTNDLVGCSFGFRDKQVNIKKREGKISTRLLKEIDLMEVSILSTGHCPAYYGTLVEAREENVQPTEIRYIDSDIYEKELLIIKTYL